MKKEYAPATIYEDEIRRNPERYRDIGSVKKVNQGKIDEAKYRMRYGQTREAEECLEEVRTRIEILVEDIGDSGQILHLFVDQAETDMGLKNALNLIERSK